MYYQIKLKRVENGTEWVTPGYFRNKTNAEEKATFWDKFYGKTYDGISTRIWEATVISSRTRPRWRRLT